MELIAYLSGAILGALAVIAVVKLSPKEEFEYCECSCCCEDEVGEEEYSEDDDEANVIVVDPLTHPVPNPTDHIE
jgi:hypothetical protein